MRVISKRALREFWTKHRNAAAPLTAWHNTIRGVSCAHPAELKTVFSSADFVGDLTVFDIGGNKFRLITFIDYRSQIVYVKHVLTHGQYDEGRWKQ